MAVAAGCTGGGGQASSRGGSVSVRAQWEQPSTAAGAEAGGSAGFGTTLPAAVVAFQVTYTDASGATCCVAIDPRTAPTIPSTGERLLVLGPLAAGSGRIVLTGFPSALAPAPPGTTGVCPTRTTAATRPCDDGGFTSPSFRSASSPVSIIAGIQTDAGDIPIPALPFVVPGAIDPGPAAIAPNPLSVSATIADAGSGVDPQSIQIQARRNGNIVRILSITNETACDDLGNVACSQDGALEVTGYAVTAGPDPVVDGPLEVRVSARNLTGGVLDLPYPITAESNLPTATPSATPSETPSETPSVTPTETPSETPTNTPTQTPTTTATSTPTADLSQIAVVGVAGPAGAPSPALVLIDRLRNQVANRIPLSGAPGGVALLPDRPTALVTTAPSSLVGIDLLSGGVSTSTTVAPVAGAVAVNPVVDPGLGRLAYVGSTDQLTVVNTDTGGLVDVVGQGSLAPSAVAVTPDGAQIYVAEASGGTAGIVTEIESGGDRLFDFVDFDVGTDPSGIAVAPNGAVGYVTNREADSITVLSPTAPAPQNTVVGTIALPQGSAPVAVAFAPDSATAFVANSGSNTVTAIDVADGRVGSSVSVPGRPVALAVTPDGAFVYAAAADAGNVSVIDTARIASDPNNAVVANIDVGANPTAIAIAPLPGPAILCGDGVVTGSETCDDGGTCVGGAANGQPCPANVPGGADCGSGYCRATGGDGCAANCTAERLAPLDFPDQFGFAQGLSVGSSFFTSGTLDMRLGDPTGSGGARNAASPFGESFAPGVIPIAVALADNPTVFAPIDLPTSPNAACICLLPLDRRTCGSDPEGLDCSARCSGGDLDGQLCTSNAQCPNGTCAPNDGACGVEDGPCGSVHGPGNIGNGSIDCGSADLSQMSSARYTLSSNDPPPNVSVFFDPQSGEPGNATLALSVAASSRVGACSSSSCGADEPDKGTGLTTLMTTASGNSFAAGIVVGANGTSQNIEAGGNCSGPCTTTAQGTAFSCSSLAQVPPSTSGGSFANAFAVQNLTPIGDAVVTQQLGNLQ